MLFTSFLLYPGRRRMDSSSTTVAMIHLGAFTANYGAQLWVTLVAGKSTVKGKRVRSWKLSHWGTAAVQETVRMTSIPILVSEITAFSLPSFFVYSFWSNYFAKCYSTPQSLKKYFRVNLQIIQVSIFPLL